MADVSAPPLAHDAMQGVATNIVAPAPVAGVAALAQAPAPAAAAPAPEEVATETLYIQNLNEKIKIPVLKASLRGLFKSYGEVLDVVAHSNLRMRGQAFVSFESPEIARKALKEVRGFPLYSKPMVCVSLFGSAGGVRVFGRLSGMRGQQISFARTRSDAVVKKLDADNLEAHKQRRLEHKSVYSFRVCSPCLTECRGHTVHESHQAEIPPEASGSGEYVFLLSCPSTLCSSWLQWTVQVQCPQQNGQTSRCRTSTCRRTRFSSSKTCPRTSARISSWPCSHST